MPWKVSRAIAQVGRVQPLDLTLDISASDELMALWVDDVCWQVQLVAWSMHRPSWWWWRERREWRRRREDLNAVGEGLREQARVVEHSGARQNNIDGKDG